jgi:hypothetical protein
MLESCTYSEFTLYPLQTAMSGIKDACRVRSKILTSVFFSISGSEAYISKDFTATCEIITLKKVGRSRIENELGLVPDPLNMYISIFPQSRHEPQHTLRSW